MKKKRQPGFLECMRLMGQHDSQLQEDGFFALAVRAPEYTQQLMEAFVQEDDASLRCWLLELLGEARDVRVFPLFLEALHSSDLICAPEIRLGACGYFSY